MISTFNEIREDKQNALIQLELISKCLKENKDYLNKVKKTFVSQLFHTVCLFVLTQLKECETRRIRIESLREYIIYRKHLIQQSTQICEEKKHLLDDRRTGTLFFKK